MKILISFQKGKRKYGFSQNENDILKMLKLRKKEGKLKSLKVKFCKDYILKILKLEL